MTPVDDFRRAVEAAKVALDAFDAATRALREALSWLVHWVETSPDKIPTDELLTIADVVKRYKVKKRVILEARRKKHLRGKKPAGSNVILFERGAIEAWLEGRSAKLRAVK